MKKLSLISWNVNGLRAVARKGFSNFIKKYQPDVLCIQETKAREMDLGFDIKSIGDYHSYFSSAERKGYSGVAIYSKSQPKVVEFKIGIDKFDQEGRVIMADFESFILLNVYFPNGKRNKDRLAYKMEFYDEFLKLTNKLQKNGKKIIVCGDVNTAHREIDLARPKENEKISGFLPEERSWIDKFLASGFIDTFREFNQKGENYSWWSMRTRARERNVGWRIDYFFVTENIKKKLKNAQILPEVMGSDHCPISIDVEV
jgi:exodeoxyribonuclease III